MENGRHPDFEREQTHLENTLSVVRDEISRMEKETGWSGDKSKLVVVRSDTIDQEVAVHNVLMMKASMLYQLTLSRRQPYFTRVDFIERGAKDTQTYYIGRWGVTRSSDYQTVVVDWRSPVANLYYSGELGSMSYTAPDGTVEGELTLKRMFSIEDGVLRDLFDTGIYDRDAYLLSVLSEGSSGRLRDIVTTIQREQNDVIRHPMETALIVQGVAGSGKTTIALHRIAYLLYAYQNTLAPAQLMIIAPSPMFLNYIAGVLPDLGVEQVRQTTFPMLCAALMGKCMPRVAPDDRLEKRLLMNERDAAALNERLRVKGSLDFRAALLEYLDGLAARVVPGDEVRFGKRVLMTVDEQKQIFDTQLRVYPLAQREKEMEKFARNRARAAAENMRARLEDAVKKRLDEIETARDDPQTRSAHARRLMDNYDARSAEIAQEETRVMREYPALWPDLTPVHVYADFLSSNPRFAPLYDELAPYLKRGMVFMEDLPAVVTICRVTHGLKRVPSRHVVVDEAQDFSPFHYALLREAVGHASFTIVGDLMQGIRGAEGLPDWESARVLIPGAEYLELSVSYRNTVEIMDAARSVAARHAGGRVPGMRAVVRHGEKPLLERFSAERDAVARAAEQARRAISDGFSSVALVARTQKSARRVMKLLPPDLGARLMNGSDEQLDRGVMVFPSSAVKGLEFDVLIVCDAQAYADTLEEARLLYVLMTRPLHRLALLSVGAPSPLLSEMEAAI